MALIALQGESGARRARARASCARTGGASRVGSPRRRRSLAFRLHGVDDEIPPRSTRSSRIAERPSFSRVAARARLGGARDGPRCAPRAVEVALMSMTRRDLLIRSGAVAAGPGRGALVAAADGRFDGPPRSIGRLPEAGRSAVAVLRAERYDGDLEGAAARRPAARAGGRARALGVLKPNLVEFFRGSAVNTDPRMVVAAADALRASVQRRSSSPRGRATGATPRPSSSVGPRDALDDARLPFVDLNDAPLVRTPLRTRYTGPARALGAARAP